MLLQEMRSRGIASPPAMKIWGEQRRCLPTAPVPIEIARREGGEEEDNVVGEPFEAMKKVMADDGGTRGGGGCPS